MLNNEKEDELNPVPDNSLEESEEGVISSKNKFFGGCMIKKPVILKTRQCELTHRYLPGRKRKRTVCGEKRVSCGMGFKKGNKERKNVI